MSNPLILNLARLPARIDSQQAADLLGFKIHDIPILMRAKLLSALGNPAKNGPKYFCSAALESLAQDPNWIDKATKAIQVRVKSTPDFQMLEPIQY